MDMRKWLIEQIEDTTSLHWLMIGVMFALVFFLFWW